MLAASADNEALMRCRHVKRHTDRMTMDGCTLTEMSFPACPPQFSERYRQARCPLRISTASVWDTDEGSSLNGELCKRWAKGIPLHVLPPAAVVRKLKDIHARTRPDNVAVPDSSHGDTQSGSLLVPFSIHSRMDRGSADQFTFGDISDSRKSP